MLKIGYLWIVVQLLIFLFSFSFLSYQNVKHFGLSCWFKPIAYQNSQTLLVVAIEIRLTLMSLAHFFFQKQNYSNSATSVIK